ncbi:MAG: hypothetical protein CMQ20_09660 [Gammaproteobacteria bacterium]|nr:hypothetical protein [Gammaproteobacteria bacterium]
MLAFELDDFVERLATRIASFPITAIQSVKLAGDAAQDDPREALLEEAHQFNLLRGTSELHLVGATFNGVAAGVEPLPCSSMFVRIDPG